MPKSLSCRLVLGISWLLFTGVQAQYGAMQMQNELSPRYYVGLDKARLLDRDSGVCASNSHSCLDVNATSVCCPNTQYCIIDPSFNAMCCAIGSNCNSPCSSDAYLCNTTITISSTATTTTSCCPRACPSTSLYKCAASLGGGCCNYDAECLTSSQCALTITPSTTSALVSIVPSGCTTSQITCASSLGGGCCGVGFSCAVLSGTNYCSTGSSSPAIRTGSNGIISTSTSNPSSSSSSSGLSTGAKAGIGVGVSIIGLAVLGAALWLCTVHRRRALPGTSLPPNENENGMSEISGPIAGSKVESGISRRTRPSAGRQGSDYFTQGSERTAPNGPYTGGSAVTTPGRGVPATPQSPNDIVVPVEIGSTATSPGVRENPVELE